jgi:hypothetical protein
MSQGYVPSYEDEDLEKMEDDVAPISRDLANRIADTVLPQRGNGSVRLGPKFQKTCNDLKQVFCF